MIVKVLASIVLGLTLIFTSIVLIQTWQGVSAISLNSSGYRSGVIDYTKKDYICSDSKVNKTLESTLLGKTGCVSEEEIRIKKMAADVALERGAISVLGILLVGGLFLIGLSKVTVVEKTTNV